MIGEAKEGGVLIAVSNGIPSRQISLDSQLDIILVQLEVLPEILVYCVYIPPGNDETDFCQMLDLTSLIPNNSDLLLPGDFNAPDVNWSTLIACSTRLFALSEYIFNKNLIQMVSSPMHHLGNTLDLILINCFDRVSVVRS